MDIYLYVDAPSPLHRLDPRTKMASLVALIFLAVAADHPLPPAVLLLAVLAAAQLGRAWPALRRVRLLLFLIGSFSMITWSFFARGSTRLVGPIEVEAVLFGIGTGLKLIATIAGSVVFLATTKNEEIAAGLLRLRLPYPVVFAFSTALRLVPTFVGSGMTIIEAQRSRGLDVESGGLMQRMRRHLPLMVPILAVAIRSTNQLALALESRGFRARPERTSYLELRYRPADWIITAAALILTILALYLRLFTQLLRIPGLLS